MRVMLILLVLMTVALAHEGEAWINDKNLHDPVSKEFCCGPADCRVLADGNVSEVHGGWRVVLDDDHDAVFVPYERALPFSPDTHFHVCTSFHDGQMALRCFITPPNPS